MSLVDDFLGVLMFVGPLLLGIFAFDLIRRRWRADEWKRRLKRRPKAERRAAHQ